MFSACLIQTNDTNLIPGDDGTTDYQFRNTAPSAKAKSPLQEVCQEWKNRFRVYFPSDYTVNHIARSRNRRTEDIGGTVCFSSKYWESPKFPRDILMDCPSKRSVMMHNKVCFVTSVKQSLLATATICLQWSRSSLWNQSNQSPFKMMPSAQAGLMSGVPIFLNLPGKWSSPNPIVPTT